MGHPMRLELTLAGLLVKLVNHYTIRGAPPVMLVPYRMRSISLLPSLSGPHWPGRVAPNSLLSLGQIELNCVLIQNRIV